MNPEGYRYTTSHEWADIRGDIVTVGVTRYASEQYTNVTHVEPKPVGTAVEAGAIVGEIEAVKAVFEILSPVAGVVLEINPVVGRNPATIAEDPYELGWIVRLRMNPGFDLSHLLSAADYDRQLAGKQ